MAGMAKRSRLSTDPYKGVRDFYPEEMAIEKWMFGVMRRVAERFGYVEYGASLLEPTELYEAKSSEEIVAEQTYTFADRGGRSVTLRPEMTPTLARMVAAKRRELSFPLRWYSIPNVFRYERPQRGRTREHWQLNCDLLGIPDLGAEREVIEIVSETMREFGASPSDFVIRIGSRKTIEKIDGELALRGVSEKDRAEIRRLIDRKGKMDEAERAARIEKIARGPLPVPESEDARRLIETLAARGIKNAAYDPDVVRGFEYYTGIVFEVFDTNPKNSRSLAGGGRYDNLLEVFGADPVPAVGFGMGDVTLRDFLEGRGLLPPYRPATDALIAIAEGAEERAERLARALRTKGLNLEEGTPARPPGEQMKAAEKRGIRFAIRVERRDSGAFPVRDLATRRETEIREEEIGPFLLSKRRKAE